jgi:hypothetical protein
VLLFLAMCMILKTTFSQLCFLITIAFMAWQKPLEGSPNFGGLVSGLASGGPAGALSSLTGGGSTSNSSGMVDEYGLETSAAAQQPFSSIAPGDIPMMSATEADLYNSLAASAAGTAVAPMNSGYQDFGSLSPAMPAPGYTTPYPADPMLTQQYSTAPGYGAPYPTDPMLTPQYAPTTTIQQPQISPYDASLQMGTSTPVVVTGPGSPGDSGQTMDTAMISGGTLGGAALLGGGGMLMGRIGRRPNPSQANTAYAGEENIDEFGNLQTSPRRPLLKKHERDVDFGEIYFDIDKNGNEIPRIKRASPLRRALWSERKKLEYELKFSNSSLELDEAQKDSHGIRSITGIQDKMQKIEELRMKIALLPPDKNSSSYTPGLLTKPTYSTPSSLTRKPALRSISTRMQPRNILGRPLSRTQPQARPPTRFMPPAGYRHPMPARR